MIIGTKRLTRKKRRSHYKAQRRCLNRNTILDNAQSISRLPPAVSLCPDLVATVDASPMFEQTVASCPRRRTEPQEGEENNEGDENPRLIDNFLNHCIVQQRRSQANEFWLG